MKHNLLDRRVTVLGARGFIGSAVLAALEEHDGILVTGMVREKRAAQSQRSGAAFAIGDVTNEDAVRRAVRGADCVVHAASYIGYDPDLCEQTNIRGTQVVADACLAAGVRRLLYVSTAAVYEPGPHVNAREYELAVNPGSTLSLSRARAEDIVLNEGGAVIRPHFVYGTGDRWFVPGILRLAYDLGGLIGNGAAPQSVIDVSKLGTAIAVLALKDAELSSNVFHAAGTEPSSLREMLSVLAPEASFMARSLSDQETKALAVQRGVSLQRIGLLSTEHSYDSMRLRDETGIDLGGRFLPTVEQLVWYHKEFNP